MTRSLLIQEFPCFQCRNLCNPRVRSVCVRRKLLFVNQHRHYARKRPTPTFSSGAGEQAHESRPKTIQERADEIIKERASRPRRFFTPGKLIIVSIIGYIGYRVYNWQINPRRSLTLNPRFFTPFILLAREAVSPTSSVLDLLSVPKGQNTANIAEAWRAGVWSVQIMQPDLQIARLYTPLPPIEGVPDEQLRFFIRKEDLGEVSGFLHQISPGTLVHMRGPRTEYRVPDDVDEILFLAGGTGIAPALQVAYTLFAARADTGERPRIRILWANRKREDSRAGLDPDEVKQFRLNLTTRIRNAMTGGGRDTPPMVTKPLESQDANVGVVKQTLLVDQVEQMATHSNGKITVDYFVDEEGTFITERLLRSYLDGQPSPDGSSTDAVTPKKKLLLIAGPDGFVDHYAGPKEWQGGKEIPGPLGGMLMKIDPKGWDIWKL